MINELAKRDRERGFADWGTEVVLRQVGQTFDPQTGLLTETFADREVQAIAGDAALAAIGQTAGHGNQFGQMFLVRSDDMEADVNPRLLRVVHGGREYRVEELEGWPQGGMTLLRCVVV
jgi:hypothetical protein